MMDHIPNFLIFQVIFLSIAVLAYIRGNVSRYFEHHYENQHPSRCD